MEQWKIDAKRMRFKEDKPISVIVEYLHKEYFPDMATYKVKEKLRSFIRHTPEYKASKATEQSDTVRSTIEYKADGSTVSTRVIELAEGQEMTPEVIVKAHGLDPTMWTVVSYVNNFWNAQQKGGRKLIMYQSKLTVKPNAKGLSFENIDKLYSRLDRTAKPIPVSYVPRPDGLIAEVNIADLHIGKLAWNGDTGNNFDYKIARAMFNQVINEISD
ncbi:MAG: hypothetical protein GX025_10770, partial [Clostridiales bacterium]|nr:hypothetical protein [Clostridiales bacterium]